MEIKEVSKSRKPPPTQPSTKRILVSVNEVRGKTFTSVTRDYTSVMLSNDVEFYRLSYVMPWAYSETEISTVTGSLSLLRNAPLDVQKVETRMGQQFVEYVTSSYPDMSTVDEHYRFSTHKGAADIWYTWDDSLQGYPVCIKCGSHADVHVRWEVDSPTSEATGSGDTVEAHIKLVDHWKKELLNEWGDAPVIIVPRHVVSEKEKQCNREFMDAWIAKHVVQDAR
jgi:hypothetical protein